MSDPIRVGIIRCDTHGMWFAALMDDHDPLLLQRPAELNKAMPYSWHKGIIHYYYYSRYREPLTMTARRVDGFRVTRVWDEDRASAEIFANVFHNRPKVCERFEQVSDDVDLVLIADCNGDGADHLALARPGLEKGVATFVDKPMALSVADCVDLWRLSQKHGAPLASMSILQTDPRTGFFASRIPEVGQLHLGTVQCPAMHPAATIGAIAVCHRAFGTGIERVSCLEVPNRQTIVHLDYGARADRPPQGVVLNGAAFDNPFPTMTKFSRWFAAAYGSEDAVLGMVLDGYSAGDGASIILDRVKEMMRTRRNDPMTLDMIRAVAVDEARREACAARQAVAVRYPDICNTARA